LANVQISPEIEQLLHTAFCHSESRFDLIDNQHNVVAVAQLANVLQVLLLCRNAAAVAHDWFDKECANVLVIPAQQIFDNVGVVQRHRVAKILGNFGYAFTIGL
jgi:hypothetical protein